MNEQSVAICIVSTDEIHFQRRIIKSKNKKIITENKENASEIHYSLKHRFSLNFTTHNNEAISNKNGSKIKSYGNKIVVLIHSMLELRFKMNKTIEITVIEFEIIFLVFFHN